MSKCYLYNFGYFFAFHFPKTYVHRSQLSFSSISFLILLSPRKTLRKYFVVTVKRPKFAFFWQYFFRVKSTEKILKVKRLFIFSSIKFFVEDMLNYDLQQFCLYNTKVSKFGISARKTFTLVKKNLSWGEIKQRAYFLQVCQGLETINKCSYCPSVSYRL